MWNRERIEKVSSYERKNYTLDSNFAKISSKHNHTNTNNSEKKSGKNLNEKGLAR